MPSQPDSATGQGSWIPREWEGTETVWGLANTLPCASMCLLGVVLSWVSLRHGRRLFLGRHGRSHRLLGLAYLLWLGVGCIHLWHTGPMPWYAINVVLGVLGVATTQSAAMAFKDAHSRAKNPASGTLDQRAVVTYDEMIEHAFYQGLNLAQVMYLHLVAEVLWLWARVALAMLVILPWWWRGRFPVNSFSANYRSPSTANTVVGVMYRVKKAQYLLYKHALLHGLNVSVAVAGLKLAGTPPFQSYWLLLNAAYVMEFFLQTLVRRR